jgi:hypothetical protein
MHIFDKLVSVAKSPIMPVQYTGMIRVCKLFEFDTVLTVAIENSEMPTSVKVKDAGLRTQLPFPVTAVSLKNIVIVLDQKLGQQLTKFIFLYKDTEVRYAGGMLAYGTINPKMISIDELCPEVTVDNWLGEQNSLLFNAGPRPEDKDIQLTLRQCITATYKTLVKLNTIDRFVLEVSPRKPSKKALKPGAIPKLRDRPEYLMLTPKEIRKYLGTHLEDTGRVQSVHERRGHIRTYPDDKERFPNAHGKSIWIDAVWIGESEAIVGNKKYRVVLENTFKGETSC